MRFKVTLDKKRKHDDLVSCVGWTVGDDLFSCRTNNKGPRMEPCGTPEATGLQSEKMLSMATRCLRSLSDDQTLLKTSYKTRESVVVGKLPQGVYPTELDWYPVNMSGRQTSSELFALATTDGKFHIVTKNGRFEKSIESHSGAVITLKWSLQGNSLVTAGEDGQVKIWSRSGMLRSTLAQVGSPVYSVSWDPDGESVLYAIQKQLVIKPLSPSSKPVQWKAHDGTIMKVDWNAVNNLIVSGGEDRKYKVWDAYGRAIYSSQPHHYPIMAVAWAPNGQFFAVGAFNTLRLCDKSGWSHSLEKPETGSLYSINWSHDSTLVAAACGNGHVLIGSVVDERLEWGNIVVTLIEENVMIVENVVNGTKDQLDFRDRIVKMSIGCNHFVVATSSQCLIYNTKSWSSPLIFDLKGLTTNLILIAQKVFALVDSVLGITIYSYDGRVLSSPKYSGMRTDIVNENLITLSNDTLVIQDNRDNRAFHVFDVGTGREITEKPLYHSQEVTHLVLDQAGDSAERSLAVVDKNNDLFILPIRNTNPLSKIKKIGAMVTTLKWHDKTNMLAAIQDGRFTVWYYPHAVYIDANLLQKCLVYKDAGEFGRSPQIASFLGHHCTMRTSNGALVSTAVSPYPIILQNYVHKSSWSDAVRLCRFVKDPALWASLAAIATAARDLETAEIAYAAINEADKVEYISAIKDSVNRNVTTSEMAMFCKQPGQAEGILLQSGLTYRAIQLNIDLFKWKRALDLAIKHQTHVDTVLAYRQQYLKDFGLEEKDGTFLQYNKEIKVDWPTIQNKIQLELENERK